MANSDAINTLVFTIIEHFIGTPSELVSRIHDQLSNLRCPTMSDFRWYKDVFISRVMVREDSSAPFWKEKFINGLPSLFAHKIKQVLVNEDNIIEYDNFTYGNLVSIIQREGLKMCIDMKISNTANKDKRKAKYEMGNFCEQYGLPSVAPSRRHKPHKNLDKTPKRFKSFKKRRFESNEFYKKPQHKSRSKFSKPKQRSKDGCYKCGKKGHFAVDCKAKKTIKQLQISNEDKENLIKVLDIRDTESSEPDSDYSVSSSSSNSSHSGDEQKCQNISFGCQDTCCNTIKVLTKTEEHEELLLELISKIEDPES
jgi:hypothetical protein